MIRDVGKNRAEYAAKLRQIADHIEKEGLDVVALAIVSVQHNGLCHRSIMTENGGATTTLIGALHRAAHCCVADIEART